MNKTSNSDQPKIVSLAELERSTESSVYVLNNSVPRGIINFSINDGLGNAVTIKVPITWMPIDLTTQATKASVLSSPQFRRLLSGRQDRANLL